jgi:hypothetical protein
MSIVPPPPAAQPAATSTASTASTVASAIKAVAASVAAAVVAVGKLYVGPGCSGVFLVEDIEGRQGDVGDFLLT